MQGARLQSLVKELRFPHAAWIKETKNFALFDLLTKGGNLKLFMEEKNTWKKNFFFYFKSVGDSEFATLKMNESLQKWNNKIRLYCGSPVYYKIVRINAHKSTILFAFEE